MDAKDFLNELVMRDDSRKVAKKEYRFVDFYILKKEEDYFFVVLFEDDRGKVFNVTNILKITRSKGWVELDSIEIDELHGIAGPSDAEQYIIIDSHPDMRVFHGNEINTEKYDSFSQWDSSKFIDDI